MSCLSNLVSTTRWNHISPGHPTPQGARHCGSVLKQPLKNPAEGNLPLDVNLFAHVVALLPAPNAVLPVALVRAYLFDAPLLPANIVRRLYAVAEAAESRPPGKNLMPTRDQAARLIDQMNSFIAEIQIEDPIFGERNSKRLISSMGRALGSAIVPSLEPTDLTPARLEIINLCAGAGAGGGMLAGLHEVARLSPSAMPKVITSLRRALTRGDMHDVEGASRSIAAWAEAGKHLPSGLPEALKDALIASLEAGIRQALQFRIWCVRRLVKEGALSTSQTNSLSDLLPELWDGLQYEQMPQEGPEAIGITLARAECVRLAAALAALDYEVQGRIIAPDTDPLPEVRFANFRND